MERSNEDGSAGEYGYAAEPYHPAARGGLPYRDDGDARPWLQRTIETEIIPRLMLAHRPQGIAELDRGEADTDVLDGDDVERFSRMVLNDEVEACAGFVGALRERGIGLEQIYLGLVAPAATPRAIVKRLSDEVLAALQQPEVLARLEGMGTQVTPASAEDFDALIRSETERWSRVIRERNIKAEG